MRFHTQATQKSSSRVPAVCIATLVSETVHVRACMDDQLMTMQLAAIAHGLSAAVAGNAVPAQLGAAIEAALPFARALRCDAVLSC